MNGPRILAWSQRKCILFSPTTWETSLPTDEAPPPATRLPREIGSSRRASAFNAVKTREAISVHASLAFPSRHSPIWSQSSADSDVKPLSPATLFLPGNPIPIKSGEGNRYSGFTKGGHGRWKEGSFDGPKLFCSFVVRGRVGKESRVTWLSYCTGPSPPPRKPPLTFHRLGAQIVFLSGRSTAKKKNPLPSLFARRFRPRPRPASSGLP